MLDFLSITSELQKNGVVKVYPKFRLYPVSQDLMIQGGDFYAVWLDKAGKWSKDESDVLRQIDDELDIYVQTHKEKVGLNYTILYMWDSSNGMIDAWHKFVQKQTRDSFTMLDESLTFSNTPVNKKDYSSKRLSYPLEPGKYDAWDKLIGTLYEPEERHKLEWSIGSIVTGDSKELQKFVVLYGAAGAGKSTILNVIQELFDGYYTVFDAKALGSNNAQFALESFKDNPLVAIQHDGDLSRIEDNTRLNSLVSHERMTVNEKFKSAYSARFKCFLFMGTNKPVRITDAKSGLLRRLIDVTPSGRKLDVREYRRVVGQIPFELGAIACRCRDVYLDDPHYYDDYQPASMFEATNDFYNFMVDHYHIFKKEDGVSLQNSWEMYKTWLNDANMDFSLNKRQFKEEIVNYFREFDERHTKENGETVRSYYHGFRTERFEMGEKEKKKPVVEEKLMSIDCTESIFDDICKDCPAQYVTEQGTPMYKWDNVMTTLKDVDTKELHYVKVPENHIVIDFDIPGPNGQKDLERNLKEASKWPPTYAELSRSGAGIHLHYIYSGDVSKLSRVYDDRIEIKVFNGNSSLRRKLSKCNNLPIATISSGLPLKEEKSMVDEKIIFNEKAIRTMIKRNMLKEYHPGTKPSVDYIYKILEDAYKSGVNYDVSDMENDIIAFALSSTNHSDYCFGLACKMKFKSENVSEPISEDEKPIAFFDCEVFPNLFLVNYKLQGEGNPVVRMINPSPSAIEDMLKFNLIGFNNRRYDNHMIYGCYMGYTNEELYDLSQRIISGDRNAFFGEAYNLSYTDIYDFCSKKQSLKKWEIELGIHHLELGLPWDQPVPEDQWCKVAEYCDNDVIATEAVFNARKADWLARQILADLADMTVNDTSNSLTTRIIFGSNKNPNLVYTDLATGISDPPFETDVINAFPGYEFVYSEEDKKFHNMYRGTDIGFGGYVKAEPGMYTNAALLDIASQHPNSAINMNAFGEYTQNYKDLLDARIAIKHNDFDAARKMLGGKLAKYLEDEETAAMLSQALKIPINSVYGLTSASFSNPFRDPRNKNNIIALRGALFMRTLEDEIITRGFKPFHFKTDSVKIADATPEIIDFVMEFGKKYGYTFEHEATYDKICLVNGSTYIARYSSDEKINGNHCGRWTATAAQFQVPYVFKTLFSGEPIEFDDLCETKEVKTALYLDANEGMGEDEHNYTFVGRVGQFCPIKPGCGGAELMRKIDTGYSYVTGTKGYRWLESEMVKLLGKEGDINKDYYNKLVDDAVANISQYGDFEWFRSDEPVPPVVATTPKEELPWKAPCGKDSCTGCKDLYYPDNLHIACKHEYDISDYASLLSLDEFLSEDDIPF